jgi:predicted RNase H-like HicB family nuclease
MKTEKVNLKTSFTAVVQRDAKWWIGWIEEIPGVNGQGRTRKEFMENLKSALREALESNCDEALAAISGKYEEVRIEELRN